MTTGPLGGPRPFAESKLAIRMSVDAPNNREGEKMLERKARLYRDAVPLKEQPSDHSESRRMAGNHIPNVILSTFNNLTRSKIYLENIELSETKSRSTEHPSETESFELTYTIDQKWQGETWALKEISSHSVTRLHEVFIKGGGEPDRYRNERIAWPSTWNPEKLDVKFIRFKSI